MDGYDDDERAAAYQRYIFAEFADIVQHYDDTARPDHDNIDYTADDLNFHDGTEYDDNGDPVIKYGLIFFVFRRADDNDLNDYHDDYDDYDGSGDDNSRTDNNRFTDDGAELAARFFDLWGEADDYDHHPPIDNLFRFPLYDPRRGPCKRPYGFFYTSRDWGNPPV